MVNDGCHRDLGDGCRSDTQDVRWKELGIYVGFGTECVDFGMKETWNNVIQPVYRVVNVKL